MKSQRILLTLFVFYTCSVFTASVTSRSFAGDKGCNSEQVNESLYEMVPNIVLPKSIQYKTTPESHTDPGTYFAANHYPATYTAFPSYVLPYPTEIRPVQQALYPVTPPAPIQPVAPYPQPPFQMYTDFTPPQIVIVAIPTNNLSPAIPDQIKDENTPEKSYDPDSDPLKLDVLHFYDLELPEPDFGNNSRANGLHVLRPIRTAGSRFEPAKFILAQYQIPAIGSGNDYPNYTNAVNPYGTNVEPKPLLSNTYTQQPQQYQIPQYQPQQYQAAYPYQYQQPQYHQPLPQYGVQYPPQQSGNTIATEQQSQVPSEVLNQIQQLITQNPNLQFTAVMMGPNGQLIPLGAGTNPQLGQQGNQGNGWQQSMQQNQQAQLVQQQMQYIQQMNQYAQQMTDAQNAKLSRGLFGRQQPVPAAPAYANYGGYGNYQQPGNAAYPGVQPGIQPQMQFVQPMPGMQNAYAMGNPYYMAMYGSMQMPQMYGPMMTPYGFGVMTNPYYPMYPMMQQPGYGQPQYQQPRGFLDRLRERRRTSERSMCEAWRAPHFPEETSLRLPAKDAYPWGYFGAQTADMQTANFGGYYGMYCGHATYPGQ